MFDMRPGDYVECVDNRPQISLSTTMPELDRLYTVESVRAVDGGHSVRLNELAPTCHQGGPCRCGECGWDARRFKRVYRPDSRKLAPFRELLRNPAPAIADPVSSL